jgi:hypothetical protein
VRFQVIEIGKHSSTVFASMTAFKKTKYELNKTSIEWDVEGRYECLF